MELMMIHLDTSFLIRALIAGDRAASLLEEWIGGREEISISAVAWSEFLCGPLNEEEKQLAFTVVQRIESFLAVDAERAADLFNLTGRRSRSLADCQIAAIAMRCSAQIATLNVVDFDLFKQYDLKLV